MSTGTGYKGPVWIIARIQETICTRASRMPYFPFCYQGMPHPVFFLWTFIFLLSKAPSHGDIWRSSQQPWPNALDEYVGMVTLTAQLPYTTVMIADSEHLVFAFACDSVSRHSNLQQSLGHLDSMVLSPRRDWRNWPLIKMWELLLGKSQN
jgi:hypothetical protein